MMNAARAMRRVPGSVVTLKSTAMPGKLHTAAAEGVLALRVLAEERPVDALLGDGHGADVRVEVERAAQLHVRALEPAAHGRRRRAFEQHVAGQDLIEHIVRHGLIAGRAGFRS